MLKSTLAGMATAILLIGQPSLAQDADARRITVVGTGSSAAAPDVAIIRLGVEARDESAALALSMMSDSLTQVIESLGGLSGNIQTSTLTLQQEYDRSGSLSSAEPAYVAQSVVTVRTRDMDGLGALIDAGVEAGANRIDGISFTVADPEAALTEARMAAIAQAQAKAQLFADTAGVDLGDLITMSESGSGAGPSPRTMEALIVAPGEVSITATVTMVYAIN